MSITKTSCTKEALNSEKALNQMNSITSNKTNVEKCDFLKKHALLEMKLWTFASVTHVSFALQNQKMFTFPHPVWISSF